MNRIKIGVTEIQVIVILTDLLNVNGWFDSVELIDRLEQIKSPLVSHNNNGDRKLNSSIIKTLRQSFTLEFDRGDKCWYKR